MKISRSQTAYAVFFLVALLAVIPGLAGAASPLNISLSTAEPVQGSVLVLSGSVPDNATEMQVWNPACYRVIGFLSVPASCGADVTVVPVNGTEFSYTRLSTETPGNYSVIAAFPGPDGTFGIGYDRESRTLFYAGNKTVIANWSRSNPDEREESETITKVLASPGIDNPYAVVEYTVSGPDGATKTGNDTASVTQSPMAGSDVKQARPGTTQSPGFSGIAACSVLCLAGFFIFRKGHP